MKGKIVRIKEVIKEKDFTYESLGVAVGLTKTSIARIASGDQTPSFSTLKSMADALNVDIRDLFESTKKEENNSEPIYVYRDGKYVSVGTLSLG